MPPPSSPGSDRAPRLILLPGLDGSGELFAPLLAHLPEDCPALTIAYPGHVTWDYADLEAFVRARLPRRSAYVLCAESFSGPLAISIAASAPAHLKGLALCCSYARHPRPALAWLGPLLTAVPIRYRPTWLASRLLLGAWRSPVLAYGLKQASRQLSNATLRGRLRALSQVDVRAQLSAVRVPTISISGARDCVVPRRATAELADTLPGLREFRFNAPHLLLQTYPQEAASLLAQFVRHCQATTQHASPSRA